MDVAAGLQRILFGEEETATVLFFIEIVARTVVMYAYTMFLARMVGAGGVGQLGPFEFVLVIAIGSAAGDPMFYPDVPLLHGLLVITVIICLHRLTGFIFNRFKFIEDKVEGGPIVVVREGEVQMQELGSGALSERELFTLLRNGGVRNTGEVELAFFETNGRLSIFRYPEGERKRGRGTMPEQWRSGQTAQA